MTIPLLVNIDVNDLEGAIQFYASALGLRLGRRLFGNVAEMIGASSPIYLLEQRAGSPASIGTSQCRDYRRHWTPVHLDFVVEDIHGVVRRAQAAGAQLEEQIETHEWGYIANMADPFGHGFCLIEFIGNGYGEAPSHAPKSAQRVTAVPIGAGTTIGAGSVVTRDIPSDVFAAGNPYRIIKKM